MPLHQTQEDQQPNKPLPFQYAFSLWNVKPVAWKGPKFGKVPKSRILNFPSILNLNTTNTTQRNTQHQHSAYYHFNKNPQNLPQTFTDFSHTRTSVTPLPLHQPLGLHHLDSTEAAPRAHSRLYPLFYFTISKNQSCKATCSPTSRNPRQSRCIVWVNHRQQQHRNP